VERKRVKSMRVVPPRSPFSGAHQGIFADSLWNRFKVSIRSREQMPKKIPEMRTLMKKSSVKAGTKSIV
jgi:hypothetical protein